MNIEEVLDKVWSRELSADDAMDELFSDSEEVHELLRALWNREVSVDDIIFEIESTFIG